MKFLLSVFILLSILITSCNTSNKVVSSSFIQKRKYTRGYHFDFLAKNQTRTKSVSEKHQALAKQIIPVPKKEIVLLDENPIPDKMKNLSGNNIDLTASADNRTVILSNQKMISDYENFIQQKDNPIEQPDNRITNIRGFIGFLISTFAVLIFLSLFLLSSLAILTLFVEVILPLFLILSFLCSLTGFILGIIGIIQIEGDDKKYKGEGYAIYAVLMGLVGVVLILYILVLLSRDM